MRITKTCLFLATLLALGACKREEPAAGEPAEQAPPPPAAAQDAAPEPADGTAEDQPAEDIPPEQMSASAKISPTLGNNARGEVHFKRVDGKIRAIGHITGLAPNTEHGFHIHEKGDCSAPDGKSAGGHFNPSQTEHPHHAGDMPNIAANGDGVADFDLPVSDEVNIGKADPYDIAGHAVIVHADPDDYHSQPSGNAGARVACGVITTDNAQAPATR